MRHYLSAIVILNALLAGCDSSKSYVELCEENPEICYEFHEDSWCKKERIKVGLANLALVTRPEDLEKFNVLIAYENYESCVSHAAKIEHIKLKEKKTKRIDNMMKAREKIQKFSDETINSEHPRLLYYHWTRYLNKESLAKFLALEGTPDLETPDSQHELATYYVKRDLDKTLQLLFHSLELYQAGDAINVEIFKSLTSIFAETKNEKQAYIWLKVLELYAPEDGDINGKTLINYEKSNNLDGAFLNKVARSTLNKIKKGLFKAPQH